MQVQSVAVVSGAYSPPIERNPLLIHPKMFGEDGCVSLIPPPVWDCSFGCVAYAHKWLRAEVKSPSGESATVFIDPTIQQFREGTEIVVWHSDLPDPGRRHMPLKVCKEKAELMHMLSEATDGSLGRVSPRGV